MGIACVSAAKKQGGTLHQDTASHLRTVAAGEVIYAEGFAGNPGIYIITEGRVELSTQCEERRVVLAVLGKDECFGESALLPSAPRASTARALTFCRLIVIDPTTVEGELERVSPLLGLLLHSLIRRNRRADEFRPAHMSADLYSGVVAYANLLRVLAEARTQQAGPDDARDEVSIPLADVFQQCQSITGHPRMHVLATLKRMETLDLIALEAADNHDQSIRFDASRIVDRAQRAADRGVGVSLAAELDQDGLTHFDALVGIEKQLLLDKLARADRGALDVSRMPARPNQQFESLNDVIFIDDRTLFDTVSAFPSTDLAKMLVAETDRAVSERLLSVMTKARQHDVLRIIRQDVAVEPHEIDEIEQRFMRLLKSIKAGGSGSISASNSAANPASNSI